MKIVHVSKRFGEKEVLRDVSFVFPEGASAVHGPSGCGKTTLLRILAGLETPDTGYVGGAGRISFVFQEDRLIPHLSAEKNLLLVCSDAAKVEAALDAAGLLKEKDKRASQLSGGMRRRVAFLRGVLFPADTLLLDEPFNGVDPQRRDALAKWLKENRKGKRIVAVSHEAEDLARLGCGSFLDLNGGAGIAE